MLLLEAVRLLDELEYSQCLLGQVLENYTLQVVETSNFLPVTLLGTEINFRQMVLCMIRHSTLGQNQGCIWLLSQKQ